MAGEASLYGSLFPDENTYLADSPWFGAGVSVLRSPTPQPRNNTEAFLLPILQGLGGGLMTGYGRNQADQQMETDYRSQLAQLLGNDAPTLPEDFSPQNAKATVAKALLDYNNKQEAQQQAAKQSTDLSQLLLREYGSVLDPNTGKLVQIPELVAAKANLARTLNRDEQKDWFKQLPAASQVQAGQIEGVTSQLEDLSGELAKLNEPAVTFQPKSVLSGTKANDLVSKMNTLVPTVVRMMGDVGNLSQQEQQRIIDATIGNWTSGSEGAANRLKQLANTARDLSTKRLETLRMGITQGGDSVLNQLNRPSAGVFEQNVQPNQAQPSGVPNIGGLFNGEKVISIKKIG